MRYIDKGTFGLLTNADKMRLYLYFRSAPISVRVIAAAAGIPTKSVYSALEVDVRDNLLARRKEKSNSDYKPAYYYRVTRKGRMYYSAERFAFAIRSN